MSGIVVITNNPVSLQELARNVLTSIYAPDDMTYAEHIGMYNAIESWKEKLERRRAEGWELSPGMTEEEIQLGECALMLVKDEKGDFDERKRLFKQHGINWKKAHGKLFPEAYTEKDFIKGKEMYEKLKRERPEENPV